MAGKKFYAVAVGAECGVFTDWTAAEKQVKGFPGARYKGFSSRADAEAWLADPQYAGRAGNSRSRKKAVSPTVPDETVPGTITIYTDGGAINNPGPGGYGVVITQDGLQRELSGGFRRTTNNRMEMMAAIVALKEVRDIGLPVSLYSDSSYLVNGVNKGWAEKWRKNGWIKSDGQIPANVDLWEKLLNILASVEVQFHWVKGHSGHPLNERCDHLAVAEAKNSPQAVDVHYEELER